VRAKWWEWLVVGCGLFSIAFFVFLVSVAIYREWVAVNEVVSWYETQVKPAIVAQREREQQLLAQATRAEQERLARVNVTPTPTPTR
jgi:hypothetical protein